MPLPIESISENTPVNEVRKLIGKSIEQCIKEGKSQKECAAIAYSIAKEKRGEEVT